MQYKGIKGFYPTEQKIAYIDQLLKVGFDTIDFGSFVSHKAIPQMADTMKSSCRSMPVNPNQNSWP